MASPLASSSCASSDFLILQCGNLGIGVVCLSVVISIICVVVIVTVAMLAKMIMIMVVTTIAHHEHHNHQSEFGPGNIVARICSHIQSYCVVIAKMVYFMTRLHGDAVRDQGQRASCRFVVVVISSDTLYGLGALASGTVALASCTVQPHLKGHHEARRKLMCAIACRFNIAQGCAATLFTTWDVIKGLAVFT